MEIGKMYKVKDTAGLTDKQGEIGELVNIHTTNVFFTHELRFADGHRENFRPEELEENGEKLVTEYTKIKFKETDLPFIKGDIATIESVDYDPNTVLPYYAINDNKCGWIQQHTFEVIEDEKQPEFLPLGTKLKITNECSTFCVGSIVIIVEVDESDTYYTYKCRGIDTDLNCEMTFWVESDTFEVIDEKSKPQYVLIDTDGDYIEIYNGDYLAYADTLEEATKYDNKEALQLALAVLGLDNITIKEI